MGLLSFISTTNIKKMQRTVQISTPAQNGFFDISRQGEAIVSESGVMTGLVNIYVQGATAGIMILFI